MKSCLIILLCCLSIHVMAQQPKYTAKRFVTKHDSTKFKAQRTDNGITKTYIESSAMYYDVDDNNTTHIQNGVLALLYIESEFKNGKRNGLTRQYLIDSANQSKRYLIADQSYKNDQLNGSWNVYNLKGTRVMTQHFKDDSLHGISRQYWIDGKSIMSEREYFNGSSKFIAREYFQNGKVSKEVMLENNLPNGEVKEYYETGVVKDKFTAKNGLRDGLRVYYYPNGKPWVETIYKENKPWAIVANYDSKGNKRDGGTLKDGNGTLIFYEDDTTVREVITYRNGEQQR
jgi:antitoxin component YwqK of YwqJK toxin-antitoxin module